MPMSTSDRLTPTFASLPGSRPVTVRTPPSTRRRPERGRWPTPASRARRGRTCPLPALVRGNPLKALGSPFRGDRVRQHPDEHDDPEQGERGEGPPSRAQVEGLAP